VPPSLRTIAGALLYDAPRFERHLRGRWELIRNRDEVITPDPHGRGVRCEWEWTSDLHYCNVFPSAGARLMRRALGEWPIVLADAPVTAGEPLVSFVIGHRGEVRRPLLAETLRSIAGQDVPVECVVVEQAARATAMPAWVNHVHMRVGSDDEPYNRGAAFNFGVRHARGRVLVLHDNDMAVPAAYAREIARHAEAGWDAIDLKRFIFYLDQRRVCTSVMQNARGGSVAVTREAFDAIGGFDEGFVGWGGEDNDFWDRAETKRATRFGYLPLVHLWHAAQPGKGRAERYHEESMKLSPQERIARLRE
jgi:hypothetical protein